MQGLAKIRLKGSPSDRQLPVTDREEAGKVERRSQKGERAKKERWPRRAWAELKMAPAVTMRRC